MFSFMRFIRADNETRLKENFNLSLVEMDHIHSRISCCHLTGVSQTHKPDIVASVIMKGIFIMPPNLLLASGADLRILVIFYGHDVMQQVAVLLSGPAHK